MLMFVVAREVKSYVDLSRKRLFLENNGCSKNRIYINITCDKNVKKRV